MPDRVPFFNVMAPRTAYSPLHTHTSIRNARREELHILFVLIVFLPGLILCSFDSERVKLKDAVTRYLIHRIVLVLNQPAVYRFQAWLLYGCLPVANHAVPEEVSKNG